MASSDIKRLRNLASTLRLVMEKWQSPEVNDDDFVLLLNAGLLKTATHLYRKRTGARAKVADRYISGLAKKLKH